jgi:ATP-dependent DNA helicase DinG
LSSLLSETLKDEIQTAYRAWLASGDGKPRIGQRQMIAEIARALSDINNLTKNQAPIVVVEAGTGTGKTLAYTLAAIPVARHLGKHLVISTATVALQEQLVGKDLPDLQQRSGLQFKYALAKGRGRYLCLAKLDTALTAGDSSENNLALYPDEIPVALDKDAEKMYRELLDALANNRWDGDGDHWPEQIPDPLWWRITTDHAQCPGRRCPHVRECCFFRAREGLEQAEVIVTNHDMVLADLSLGGGVILPAPEDTIYIFDEAHHLADKTLSHFAHFGRLGGSIYWLEQVQRILRRAAPVLNADNGAKIYLDSLPVHAAELAQQIALTRQMIEPLIPDGAAKNSRFEQTTYRSDQNVYRFEQGIVPQALMDQAQNMLPLWQKLVKGMDAIASILATALDSSDSPIPRFAAEQWYPALGLMLSRAQAGEALWRHYAEPDDPNEPPLARWLEVVDSSAGQPDISLSASPIIAANTLSKFLWSRCAAAVLTSATLTALGRFDRLQQRTGLPDYTRYAIVGSPFDFANKGVLRVPAMRNEPSDQLAHTAEVIELLPELLAESVATLVLFSSRKQMETVFDELSLEWQLQILMQGKLGKQELLRRHREIIDDGKTSVLFGLASFAEGVDLPGNYCRHVIIAKIPFAVPDEPVEAALGDWIKARGGNPFMEVAVPDAALRLVQASGRLLRTEDDSGCVTILDRRLLTKRYGKAILNALPPFRRELVQ